MAANETILELVQSGLETVRGTNVAATRKVYARLASNYDRPLQTFQDTSGTYDANRRAAYGRPDITFTATDLATFEDTAWWMQLGVKGNVAGVTDAGAPPAFTYDFVPSLSTDDLKSATVEFNHVGNPYESGQVMLNTWTLRGDTDSDTEPGWMFEGNLLGRDWATTTYTPALTDRVTEVITARGTKLFVDTTTIGTTQVTGKLISWSVTWDNAIHFKAFSEDESFFAANKVGRQARIVTAQFVMEFDSDAEFANYRATVPVERKIRLERVGSLIHATPDTFKRLRIDLFGFWSSWAKTEREGNITATFGFTGYHNVAAAQTARVEVVNALTTLP